MRPIRARPSGSTRTAPGGATPPASRFVLLVLLAAAMPACDSIFPFGSDDSEGVPQITELPRSLTPAEVEVRDASNAFGFDLLREIVGEAPRETHFISPLSASMALGMALNGAAGETFEQMRATLRFEGMEEEEINASYRGLIDLLADLDPSVSFQIANAVWHDLGWEPRETYLTTVDDAFDAVVEGTDFDDPAAPDIINAWVRAHTGDRIDEIVPDPIPDDAIAYLLNAIHFKGDWTYRFDPADTHDGPFHLADGSSETVRFMERAGGFRYGATSEVEVADLPYGGDAYAMTVVVPRSGVSLEAVVAELDADGWATLVDGLTEADDRHRLLLPRFTLSWERSLKPALAALGMPIAFTEDADFTGMFEDPRVLISDVKQKSWVSVDEEGTEAAAATSVEMGVVSMPPTFAADRPFLFAIRERLSGTILFLGAVVEAPMD